MAVPSPVGDVKIVSSISTLDAKYIDTQIKCLFYCLIRTPVNADVVNRSFRWKVDSPRTYVNPSDVYLSFFKPDKTNLSEKKVVAHVGQQIFQ